MGSGFSFLVYMGMQWYGQNSQLSSLAKSDKCTISSLSVLTWCLAQVILRDTVKGWGGGREKTRQTKEEVRMTTSANGQVWHLASPSGSWRTQRNGETWWRSHLWCPKDCRDYGIDDDDYDDVCVLSLWVMCLSFMLS